jgi:hypothetical protein
MSMTAEAFPPKISADVASYATLWLVCHPAAAWPLVLLMPSPIPLGEPPQGRQWVGKLSTVDAG